MNSLPNDPGHRSGNIATPLLAAALTVSLVGLTGPAAAVSPLAPPAAAVSPHAPGDRSAPQKSAGKKGTEGRTQGGARVTFSTVKDWNLKGENLSARGHNPLYFPLKPFPSTRWKDSVVDLPAGGGEADSNGTSS